MLKIGATIFAAVMASSIPMPRQSPLQPSPHNIGVQTAPEREAQIADIAAPDKTSPKMKEARATTNSGKDHQIGSAAKKTDSDAKPAHDVFDYFSLLLPFFVALGTLMVLIVQSFLLAKTMRATEGNTTATRRNAIAAFASAKAAKLSAEIANRALTDLERPYLYVSGVRTFKIEAETVGGLEPFLQYTVSNHGRLPASIESVYFFNGRCHSTHNPMDNAILAEQTDELVINNVFSEGEKREALKSYGPSDLHWQYTRSGVGDLNYPGAVPHLAEHEMYFFYIEIIYDGPFTRGHSTRACWVWHDGEGILVKANWPPEANRMT